MSGNRPWTDAEDATLRALRATGSGYESIGAALGRSYWSVSCQAFRLGLTRRGPTVPKPPKVDGRTLRHGCRHAGTPVDVGPVEQWLPLVGWVLSHKIPEHVFRRIGRDDAEQAGIEGLLKAMRCYRPDQPGAATFKVYAVARIRWHILTAGGLTRGSGWEPLPTPLDDQAERRIAS